MIKGHFYGQSAIFMVKWAEISFLILKLGTIVLEPDQNLVPIGVTKLYCDFQLDKYMRGLKMYDGLFRTVA